MFAEKPTPKSRPRSLSEGGREGRGSAPEPAAEVHRGFVLLDDFGRPLMQDPFVVPRPFSDFDPYFWFYKRMREMEATVRTTREYPSSFSSCAALHAGARRRAVNELLTLATILNLEACTPSFAVIVFDRFMCSPIANAAPVAPVPSNTFGLIAMMCLVLSGKIVDIDRGYCGSRHVLQLIRWATPTEVRMPLEIQFVQRAFQIEKLVFTALDGALYAVPPALQCVSEATAWNVVNEHAWLEAVLLCDVFCTDTASTAYEQCEIGRAVVEIVSSPVGELVGCVAPGWAEDGVTEHKCKALFAIVRAVLMFLDTAQPPPERFYDDPYFGARQRHAGNPAVSHLCLRADALRRSLELYKQVQESPAQ
jgi:hypothetical protein